MPTTLTSKTVSADQLLVLALDHRIQAERTGSSAEQLELHRVADIYWVLATMDVPPPVLDRLLS